MSHVKSVVCMSIHSRISLYTSICETDNAKGLPGPHFSDTLWQYGTLPSSLVSVLAKNSLNISALAFSEVTVSPVLVVKASMTLRYWIRPLTLFIEKSQAVS